MARLAGLAGARMITVFIGVIGSGKDHAAAAVAGAVRIDFKDALLDMANDLVGYDVRADYEWFKEHVPGVRRPSQAFGETWERIDRDALKGRHPGLFTGRLLLQRLGTEVMRKRDVNFWIDQFMQRATSARLAGKDIVNADCRFQNEVDALMHTSFNAAFHFCDYRSGRYTPDSPHESERLAQALLAQGLRHGDRILPSHFEAAFARMEH